MAGDAVSILFMLVFGLIAIYFTLWLYILLPSEMAAKRGRSSVGWVLISLMCSPIFACLMLWLLGDNPNR